MHNFFYGPVWLKIGIARKIFSDNLSRRSLKKFGHWFRR